MGRQVAHLVAQTIVSTIHSEETANLFDKLKPFIQLVHSILSGPIQLVQLALQTLFFLNLIRVEVKYPLWFCKNVWSEKTTVILLGVKPSSKSYSSEVYIFLAKITESFPADAGIKPL